MGPTGTALTTKDTPTEMFSSSFKILSRSRVAVAAPTISTQPNVASGAGRWDATTILKRITAVSSVISLTASGSSLSYQWYKNGSLWSGQTSSSFTLSGGRNNSDAVSDAAFYYCIVSNSGGSVTSSTLTLSCLFPDRTAGDDGQDPATYTYPISYAFASGLSSIAVKVWGSGGGTSPDDVDLSIAGASGGAGGYSYGIFDLTGFTTSYKFNLVIGAYNFNPVNTSPNGNRSSTAFYTTDASSALIASIVAGGGGNASKVVTIPAQAGGAGGGTSGSQGANSGGGGGTSSSGGAGGVASGGTNGSAGTGSSYLGVPNGGAAGGNVSAGGYGYYGGGGGGSGLVIRQGGGGGSGVVFNVTSGSTTAGSGATPGNSSDAQRFTKAGQPGDASNYPDPYLPTSTYYGLYMGYMGCIVITPNA